MVVNDEQILMELQEFARCKDCISTSVRGVTTATDTFSGDGSTVTFTVSNAGLRNIRLITVGGSPKTKYTDYSINHDSNQVTFTVAPASGTNNISIQYDYGGYDRIYKDYPRVDLSIDSYPRLGFYVTSQSAIEFASHHTERVITIVSAVIMGSSESEIAAIVNTLRTQIKANKSNFYNFNFIRFNGGTGIIPAEDRKGDIKMKTLDFVIPLEFEG